MRTYVNFIEDMAKSPNMEELWKSTIRKENRILAAKSVRKYIINNFQIHYSFRKKASFIDFRKYSNKISLEQSFKIYEFFFSAKKIIVNYHFE